MSDSWNEEGNAKYPEAVYIQSLGEDRMLALYETVKGEKVDFANFPENYRKAGKVANMHKELCDWLKEISAA